MIQWPKAWDAAKGWPGVHTSESPLTLESHQWRCLDNSLWRGFDVRITTRSEALGGPSVMTFDRTIPQLKQLIQVHFKATGQRPTTLTSVEWRKHDTWLRKRGTSLNTLCNEMKLPGGQVQNRTIPQLKRLVQAYFDATGQRPTYRSPEWKNHDGWLRVQESSLDQLCDAMKLPGGRVKNTLLLKRLILEHVKVTGQRPTQNTSLEWRRHDRWLRKQGTCLDTLCNEMKLPGGYILNRTIPQLKRLILEYVEATGQRPTTTTSLEWKNHDQWRRRYGSSLHQLCNEMGLP